MFNCVLFVYVLFLSLARKKKIPKRKYTVCARRATPKPLPAKRQETRYAQTACRS